MSKFSFTKHVYFQGLVEDAAPPFHSWVPADPSHQDIYQAVVLKGLRPELPERWQHCEVLQHMSRLQAEMWHHNPAVRPTALRYKSYKFHFFLRCSLVDLLA